ncbi:hypothetical protein S40293_04298 [Stachybotrys chartarum IBT 40293]|nr:hypothetical protein S40293_04298 [Stachybotrys chartarum IBT 40293]
MELDANKDDDGDMVDGDQEQPQQQAQTPGRCLPTSPLTPALRYASRTPPPPRQASTTTTTLPSPSAHSEIMATAEEPSSEQVPMASRGNGKPALKKLVKESIGNRITKPLRKSRWNAENILIDEKSPLAKCDLRNVLSNPAAWDSLDTHERAEVLALFPDRQHIAGGGSGGGSDARPDLQGLLSDDSFRHDCASYTDNIAQGRHDPQWLAEAWAAHERRRIGEFDDYLVRRFEEDWGVAIPEELLPGRLRGVAARKGGEGDEKDEGEKEG